MQPSIDQIPYSMYNGRPPPGYPSQGFGYPPPEPQPGWMSTYLPPDQQPNGYTARPAPPDPSMNPTSLALPDWYHAQPASGPSSQPYNPPAFTNGNYPAQPPPAPSYRGSISSPPAGTSATPENVEPKSEKVEKSDKEKVAVKKRRKKTEDTTSPADGDKESQRDREKRTKTGRACDACVSLNSRVDRARWLTVQRTKKIRCDILAPGERHDGEEPQPVCAHCKHAGLECTFYMPITETRFKKRKSVRE